MIKTSVIFLASICLSFISFQSVALAKGYLDECSRAQQAETEKFKTVPKEQNNFHPGITPLERAISSGNLEEVKRLVNNGADIHSSQIGVTPLGFAAYWGRNELVLFFLGKGADINAHNSIALQNAASFGRLETAKLLIERGANINPPVTQHSPYTPLLWATQNGHFELVKLLVSKGANANDVSYDSNRSPLKESIRDRSTFHT